MKNVSKDTIIRTIVTFVALVNSVLTMIGKNPLPFSDDEVYLFFSTLLTVFSTVWSWWKNWVVWRVQKTSTLVASKIMNLLHI